MKLVRIGWESWEVLAVCDGRGRCQVLEFLEEFEQSAPAAAYTMTSFLKQGLPAEGPPHSEPLCKSLGKGIYELRKQPKGKKLRVVWFYGVERVIVCTYAFSKAERTPQIRVEQSRLLRKQYLAARLRGDLEIIEPED
jgi:phage-related protein